MSRRCVVCIGPLGLVAESICDECSARLEAHLYSGDPNVRRIVEWAAMRARLYAPGEGFESRALRKKQRSGN
ncbi:MAG: hypothetical protein ACRENK_16440 [Gemmatimonadaceae bacterium]